MFHSLTIAPLTKNSVMSNLVVCGTLKARTCDIHIVRSSYLCEDGNGPQYDINEADIKQFPVNF